jgi:hypothetical protein
MALSSKTVPFLEGNGNKRNPKNTFLKHNWNFLRRKVAKVSKCYAKIRVDRI